MLLAAVLVGNLGPAASAQPRSTYAPVSHSAADAATATNFYDSQANGNDFDGSRTLAAVGFSDLRGGVASFSGGNLVLTPDSINGGTDAYLRDYVLRQGTAEQVRDQGCRVVVPPNYRRGNATLGVLLRFQGSGSGLLLNFALENSTALWAYTISNAGSPTKLATANATNPYVPANPVAVEARVIANAAVAMTATDLTTGKILAFLSVALPSGSIPAGGFGLVPWTTASGTGSLLIASVQTYAVTAVTCDGDSLTYGENATSGQGTASPLAPVYPGALQKLLGNRYHVVNLGRSGLTVSQMSGDAATRVDALVATTEQPPVAVVEGGTNDFGIDGSIKPPVTVAKAVQTVYTRLQTYWKARHAARADTVVVDVTNTPADHPVYAQNLGSETGFNERRDALNALRKSPPTLTVARPDVLADNTGDPNIGQDGDEQNPLYFNASDKTHLSDAGYAIVAATVANAIAQNASVSTSPPAQPASLFAQTASGGTIDLLWNYGTDSRAGYEVYASTDPNNFPATPLVTTAAFATNYPVTGLQVGTTYYFRIRALNKAGASTYSSVVAATAGATPAVDLPNGFASASSLLTTNGFGTTAAIVGSALRLTNGGSNQTRSAWFKTTRSIAQFALEFTFQLTNANADGFTFAMQRSGLTALGGTGGNLGYSGIATSAAIKFDLYPGLSTTGLYLNGAAPDDNTAATATSSGAIDVTSAGVDFHSGDLIRAALTYDGTTLTETMTDLSTHATFTQTYPVNLVSVLGGSTAYLGFTAGTGGQSAQQDILSWSYNAAFTGTPGAPGGPSATPISGTQVSVAWTDQSSNEHSFRIERATGGGSFVPVGSVGANTTTFTDANLAVATTYSYRVAAVSAETSSPFSNVATVTTPVAVNLAASVGTTQEHTGNAGAFTVQCVPAPSSALTVNYTIQTGVGQAAYGTRYTLSPAPASATSGSVVIPANTTTATIMVNPAADNTLTGTQAVTLALSGGSGYLASGGAATVALLDTPLNTWKIQYFGGMTAAGSAQAADAADYDGDGIANLVEYALGTDPTQANTAKLPTVKVEAVDGGVYPTLTYIYPIPAPTDAACTVEASTGLDPAAWQATTTVAGYPVNNGDGTMTMKARTSWVASAYARSFLRLKVTRP